MRICVVGCGAVGSLFAANLAQLDDVEVWAYDASQPHVDAINANGLRLSGAGEVLSHPRATTDPAELPPCDFGIVATKAMHTDAAIGATAHAFAGRLGRDRAERDRQRGGARTARRARDPRHDVPGGEDPRAGPRAMGREGRHDARPVRAVAGGAGRDRAARRRVHPRRHADHGRRRRARPAVAQGDLQRLDEPGRRAHRPDARPRLRAARPARARLRASSTKGRPWPPRRGSSSTPIPRC